MMYVQIVEKNHEEEGEYGKVISEVPPANGCCELYEIKILSNGNVVTCDPLQIQEIEHKEHCRVCNNTFENHLLLGCDGESCVYCHQNWDDCNCGR